MSTDPPPNWMRRHAGFRKAGRWLDKTIDQLLAEAAAKVPDKVAIVADRADREQAPRLTYSELERLAGRAAGALLRRLGIGRGDIVTVQLPRSGGSLSSPLSPAARSAR